MDKNINELLVSNNTFSYCTCIDNIPHCASCFYVYITDGHYLIFKSDKTTLHIKNAILNNFVAGTILPDISKVATIKGIQFDGLFIDPKETLLKSMQKAYYKKYPFSIGMQGNIYAIEINNIKLTDNTLGF